MKTIVYISTFLFVLCSVSCNKEATLISGKITDSFTGSPLPGVTINTNPATTAVTTDASGNYTITEISSGDFTLYLSKGIYIPDTVSSTISKGKTSTLNINMNTLIGGTWSVSIPDGYTFQFKSDGTFSGNNGSGSWITADLTLGIVKWTFNYDGSPITYFGRIKTPTSMVGINSPWTATRQ